MHGVFKSFINIFSRRVTGSHRHVRLSQEVLGTEEIHVDCHRR